MLISDEYRWLNTQLHGKGHYGAGGGRWAKSITQLLIKYGTDDVLDYGCGKGTLKRNLRGMRVREYDPAIPGKEHAPEPADVVVCTDVLEHIEPEHLGEVLDHLASLVRVIGFFTIATREAKKTLPDGRNAHLIVMPADWWQLKLRKRFKVVHWQVDDERGEVIAVVKPWRKQ